MDKDAVVIIPAAGQGKRMAAGQNKLFLSLENKTILQHTLDLFLNHPRILHVYLVIASKDKEILAPNMNSVNKITIVTGGKERQDSVYNALQVIQQKEGLPRWVLVHDGARPFCSHELVTRILKQCELTHASIPIIPLTDTIREIDSGKTQVVDRSKLFATQTPQGFEVGLLLKAYQMSRSKKWQTTDDASIVEQYGHPIATTEGALENIKITTPWDLRMAEWILSQSKSISE